jgi:ferredoxin
MSEAPEVFLLDDDDQLQLLAGATDEQFRPKVQRAVRACPKQALALED